MATGVVTPTGVITIEVVITTTGAEMGTGRVTATEVKAAEVIVIETTATGATAIGATAIGAMAFMAMPTGAAAPTTAMWHPQWPRRRGTPRGATTSHSPAGVTNRLGTERRRG